MITQDLIDKYNFSEIPFILSWMSQPVNCAVLIDLEKGISIKPFITDETEMDIFINDFMIEFEFPRGMVLKEIARPNFCLFWGGCSNNDEEVIEILETGGRCLKEPYKTSENPSCPFA